MTVLVIVTDAVFPWNKGGKETRTLNYSVLLAESGFEVHIYTMKWWRGPKVIRQGEVSLHGMSRRYDLYHGARRSIWQAVMFSLCCFKLLFVRFDIVEVDQIPILPLIVVKAVCVLRRRPLIATWHEVWGLGYWQSYLGRLGRLAAAAELWVMQMPDRIIAASDGTAERVRSASGGKVEVFVGMNGIDLMDIQEAQPSDRDFDLLFVGRLLDHKGVEALINATAVLRDRGLMLSVGVVGIGPALSNLQARVAELRLADSVTFLGELPTHAEVLATMKSARLFVFPTLREGFGLAAVEALACGLPVITTSHPNNFARLLVDHDENGYLCHPSGSDLASYIEMALEDRDRLSAGARSSAEGYTWRAAVLQCLPAYGASR